MMPTRSLAMFFVVMSFVATCSAVLLGAAPSALAITGQSAAPDEEIASSLVTVVGAGGVVCSGALIAPGIVLTAAHCVGPGTTTRVVDYASKPPQLLVTRKAIVHPRYNAQAMAAHRATADVALLQLTAPVPGKRPIALGMPRLPLLPGARFTVAGVGSRSPGGNDAGTARAAQLVVTGQPGTLQVRLIDPVTQNKTAGLGGCTGDSGAPMFQDQDGRPVITGVVSWSTGPNFSDGCGGITGVTPLTLYHDWIVTTARGLGAPL